VPPRSLYERDLSGTRVTEVRRAERQLSGEYRAGIAQVLAHLGAASLDRAVHIAELPDMIRGYEHIKLERVARFRSEFAREITAFTEVSASRSKVCSSRLNATAKLAAPTSETANQYGSGMLVIPFRFVSIRKSSYPRMNSA